MRPNLLVVLGLALASDLIATPAAAYVRLTTSSGTPIEWRSSCLQFHVDDAANPDFSTQRLRAALTGAVTAWTSSARACPSAFHVDLVGDATADSSVKRDGKSMVVWRLGDFCKEGAHADDELCLSPNVTATTTVFFRDKPGSDGDGEILEADMEINAVGFEFADDGSRGAVDLPSVLAHEVGHASGLDHTCAIATGGVAPTDSDGHAVPPCFPLAALPQAAVDATMFAFVSPGDTSKRAPGDDERAAVCAVYRSYAGACASEDPKSCGCRVVAGDASPWRVALGLLAATTCVAIASRRRRRTRD